jgi:hypothetical protein
MHRSCLRARCFHTFHTPDEHLPAMGGAGTIGSAPFKKLLAANRGEISTRITRAASELGIQTAGIYSHEGTTGIGGTRGNDGTLKESGAPRSLTLV